MTLLLWERTKGRLIGVLEMKKLTMLILGGILSALPLAADTWTDPDTGYTWTYQINGDTAEICKKTVYGFGTTAISPIPTGTVAIPSTLGGKSVTSIGEHAFCDCIGLTSVTIPDGVTSIGDSAFFNCAGLTDMMIPGCVTSVGEAAFRYCSGLTRVTIGYGVASIGRNAFADCRRLTSVTVPGSVTGIGASAFVDCSGLTAVYISDLEAWCGIVFGNLTANPLYYAHNLYLNGSLATDLVIHAGVTSIGNDAFHGCSGLTSVTMPESVTSIGRDTFSGCSGLTNVTMSSAVANIGEGAFSGCSGLTSVTLPESVTSIGGNAFSGCSGLRSVTIPHCISTSVMSTVFPDSYQSVTNAIVLEGTTLVGNSLFAGCSSLVFVDMPASVTRLGDTVFQDCLSLQKVSFHGAAPDVG